MFILSRLTALAGAFLLLPAVESQDLRLSLVKPEVLQDRLRQGDVSAAERQTVIERLMRSAGCPVSLQPVSKKSANVICDLPGKSTARVVVGAHFDFAERGRGIVDDWSGTSMLVSLYESLKDIQREHSYQFVAFAGEERGLLGSARYVKSFVNGSVPFCAFVNLECLGLTQPNVWANRSTPALVERLLTVAHATSTPLKRVDVDRVGDDDTHSFLSRQVPVISIHSINQDNLGVLHSERDTLKAIDPTRYAETYRLIAFYLAYLDTFPAEEATHHALQ